ncbi:head-tail adaptor protein [Bradyrhizobium sp.]|jgi:head-tail adaptor|uniref:head-tail adaptor protein n=1 Tax=Bradyrhizobium sp. TaxID=376 RepID=UPI002DF80300|nr:head-tail adaptor protein [Bradyrhizobium sp.]
MIDPGRLKTRLQVQAPVETDDGQGGVARSYTTLTTAWAQVTPFSARGGGADVEADAQGATVKVRILLRSNFILTLQHRLVDGARIYRIAAIRDHDDRRFIAVDAELRVE